MNIFFLDLDPVLAAKMQCDKHVNKMAIESAQMLSTAHRVLHPDQCHPAFMYKTTHANHPCNVWVRQSQDNYLWLASHGIALAEEYTFRYFKRHKTTALLYWLQSMIPPAIVGIRSSQLLRSVLESRELYLQKRFKFNMRWTRRAMPDWFRLQL